ncbi:MAG: 1-acyl-sn-glycerol-3-phosphate acyltransferase [Gammaproteobacteria bacterium]|nr:1-acyl-sn-glycerol-3-phosphate acyltransferase [Gammaproteobacteria bacterium]
MFKIKSYLHYFYSLAFVTTMFLSSVYISIIGTIFLPFSFLVRYRFINFYSILNLWVLKHLCQIDYRVEGKENIPDESCIIFSKHQSALETMMVQRIFPPLTFVVKRELLWLPFFGWGLRAIDPIAIDRKAGRKAILQIVNQGIERLKQGIWIVIFPEGTRSKPGTKIKYKMGGAILASKSEHKVVPVAHTAGEFWPKGFFSRQTGTIVMSIGPAIETKGKTPDQIMQEAECWIETKMKEISTVPTYPVADC